MWFEVLLPLSNYQSRLHGGFLNDLGLTILFQQGSGPFKDRLYVLLRHVFCTFEPTSIKVANFITFPGLIDH